MVDYPTHNAVRPLAVAIDQEYHVGLQMLPPHISLKMSFPVTNMAAMEECFTAFAQNLPPLRVSLTALGLWSIPTHGRETGLLYIDIAEDAPLRAMHTRLNQELAAGFEDTQAPFDGPEFHFHLTLAQGNASFATYQRIYAQHKNTWQPRNCAVTQIALFYINDAEGAFQATTLKLLPLGQLMQEAP